MYDSWPAIRYTELKEKSKAGSEESQNNLDDLHKSLSRRLKARLYTGQF